MKKLLSLFPAFKHRNFQLYFLGQSISLTGSHFQLVAEGWLVLQLTGSAFWVGLVASLGTFPFLIVTPLSGWLIDHFPRKRILFYTQIFSFVFALAMALLAIFNLINVYEVAVLAVLLGVANAVDIPTRQSFMVEMVGKNDVASAVTVQAGIFNLSRIIGPMTAGILIALIGTGGAFLVNALSFVALAIALSNMKIPPAITQQFTSPLKAFKDGLSYILNNERVKVLFFIMTTSWLFVWSYVAIMPVVVKEVFNGDTSTLGFLYTASGVGGVLGVIAVSVTRKKYSPIGFNTVGSFLAFASLIIFSFTNNLYFSFFLLFLVGFGFVSGLSTTNGTLQFILDDHVRGRVTSLYVATQFAALTLGNFVVGYIAENTNGQFAIRIMAISAILFLGAFLLWKRPDRLFPKKLDEEVSYE